jgi:hypothetical protein
MGLDDATIVLHFFPISLLKNVNKLVSFFQNHIMSRKILTSVPSALGLLMLLVTSATFSSPVLAQPQLFGNSHGGAMTWSVQSAWLFGEYSDRK